MSDRHYVHHENEVELARLLKESKPFIEKYGTTIIYGLAAVLAIAAVVVYVGKQPPPTAEVSRKLLLAATAEDYQAVADEHSESSIGILARLRQADRELEDAVSKMFTDRETAKDHLETAAKAYQQLEDRKDINDIVRERTLVGLARVAECRCDGSDDAINAATAAWERVLKTFRDSKNFKEIAEARIKRLASTDSREFYAWFSTQNPKPGDDLLMPQDGLPGHVPPTPSLPSLLDPALQNLNFTPPEKPASQSEASTPAPATDTPAAETPTAETPAAPEPSTPETPAAPDASAPETPAAPDASAAETPAAPEKSAEEVPVNEPAPEKSGE